MTEDEILKEIETRIHNLSLRTRALGVLDDLNHPLSHYLHKIMEINQLHLWISNLGEPTERYQMPKKVA